MLVVTRRRNEWVRIGDDIRIVVLEVGTDVVKLGIDAPHSVPVHREEVYRKIQEANIAAASSRLPEGSAAEIITAVKLTVGQAEEVPAGKAPKAGKRGDPAR